MADNLASLTRFDLVRVSKLLQQIQSTLIVFILAFFLGSLIDKLFPTVGDPAEISNFTLFKDFKSSIALYLDFSLNLLILSLGDIKLGS